MMLTHSSLIGELHLSADVHRDLLQQVAWEMHKRGPEQGREIEEYMLRRFLGTTGQPDGAANVFALIRLRGALLEEEQGLYHFVHLAFQEFMAARYLAEVVRSRGPESMPLWRFCIKNE
ncbi:MAG: hypothetical protein R2911_24220 [Caldilineaceae bacterium]